MGKGGHNRKSDAVKKAKGTYRPSRFRPPPPVEALTEWPPAPERFTEAETVAWGRLGEALLEAGTVCASDLLMAEYAGQIMARVDQAMADDSTKPSSLNALIRIMADLLKNFGLSPLARNTVSPLSQSSTVEDELSEFD